MTISPFKSLLWPLLALGLSLATPAAVAAHCDGLDGPVVQAAQRALATGNPALVLIWVQPQDELEIRAAFEQTLAVRALGEDAKALADRFFFETLVRVHRAGEGASYTGLKPAGRDLGPAIPAADKAIREGALDPVVKLLTSALEHHARQYFEHVITSKAFDAGDVIAGREYVKAYVEFIHYVERIYEASTTNAHGHFEETRPAAHGH